MRRDRHIQTLRVSLTPSPGRLEAAFVDSPEVVLLAVHECHRHLLGEPLDQIGLTVDLDWHPAVTRVSADLSDQLFGHFAEVAVDAGVDDDAGVIGVCGRAHEVSRPSDSLRASARRRPLATLPVAD